MKKQSLSGTRHLALGLALTTYAGWAVAQQSPSQGASTDTSSATGIPEIIVTATKRETGLQETPLSISAVTGASLADSGVQDLSHLTQSVPGLVFEDDGPAATRVTIRGIRSVGEPTVGLYYDETPVSGAIGSANDAGGSTPLAKLFDVQRVEVLRGPQGTLYGSGSMGGTLRVIFNKPDFTYEAAVDADAVTTSERDVTVPVPKLASPLYVAVIVVPVDVLVKVYTQVAVELALPTVSPAGGHNCVTPWVNVTLPEGTTVPDVADTVAVKVTDWFTSGEEGTDPNDIVAPVLFTLSVIVGAVAPL